MAKSRKKNQELHPLPHELEELIRLRIADSGYSLTQLEKAADINTGQLSRFMRGERTVTLETASQLAKVLGFTISDS